MTREEAIEILEEARQQPIKPSGYWKATDMAIEALKAQEWIPCEERLPETSVYVLATTNKGVRTTAIIREGQTHNEKYWWHRMHEFSDGEIIAWMPLPKPYKVESEDKK